MSDPTPTDPIPTDPTWTVRADGFEEAVVARDASNFLAGNGYLGVRGTLEPWRAERFPAITLSDSYDLADGRWRELVTVPNGLYADLTDDDGRAYLAEVAPDRLSRTLDLRTGTVRHAWAPSGPAGVSVVAERFASYDDLHLVAARLVVAAERATTLTLDVGIDGDVWSLHGDHFAAAHDVRTDAPDGEVGHERLGVDLRTVERGVPIAVREGVALAPSPGARVAVEAAPAPGDGRRLRRLRLTLPAGGSVEVLRAFAVASGNDVDPATDVGGDPAGAAEASVERALAAGWAALHAANAASWAAYWAVADVEVDGDVEAQRALRFGIYHNRIATPAHSDRLPVGARGLSCQAYQGAAFWDQETYNLVPWLHADPAVARALLTYRWRTLDGARAKAKRLGYAGAFYAWISGDDGAELCPDWFFREVVTGRDIRNHFNDQQIHVAPDVVVAVDRYVTATGDEAFLRDYGAEIAFEVARFLASRVVWVPHRARWEIHTVLGPDEYHEFVDDDAFTNHQARRALAFAADVHERLAREAPEALARVAEAIALQADEPATWRSVADALFVPEPDPTTGVIEQFRGYFAHEDVTPDVLRERLIDPGEYWGWPIGVAVHTQVLKQADVLQRLVQEGDTPREVLEANYAYYEPRTQHGSSLSPSVHAVAAARLGRTGDALRYFRKSALTDLAGDFKAVSGGTFIGGVHTAACAGTWQAAVEGFGGLWVDGDGLHVAPLLPDGWTRLRFTATFRGRRAVVEADRDGVTVTGAADNDGPVPVTAYGAFRALAPGAQLVASSA